MLRNIGAVTLSHSPCAHGLCTASAVMHNPVRFAPRQAPLKGKRLSLCLSLHLRVGRDRHVRGSNPIVRGTLVAHDKAVLILKCLREWEGGGCRAKIERGLAI